VTVTHDECVVECTRFGVNVLNPKANTWTKTVNRNTRFGNI